MNDAEKDRHIKDLIAKAVEPALHKIIGGFSAHTEKTYGFVVGAEINWIFKRKEDKNEEAKGPIKEE